MAYNVDSNLKANYDKLPTITMAPPKRKRTNVNPTESDGEDRDAEFVEEGLSEGNAQPQIAVESECPYTVEYRPAKPKGKKAKRHKAGATGASGPPPPQILDQEPPEDLTVYTVKPKKLWDGLKKYRNFVVGSENFALNEYVFINHNSVPPQENDSGEFDEHKYWVARVLEIKASDEAHVYLRVYWLYWPEELPGGRQPYHGQKELIASNHMEIVDAMTVSGRANVKHWLELDEDEELPDLFWRQKFDYPSQTLMEVREHCKCHRYYNPDKLMYGCPHCKTWLHEECVQEDIKKKAYKRATGEDPPAEILSGASADANPQPVKKGKGRKSTGGSTANGKKASPSVTLDEMFDVKIMPNSNGQVTRAVVSDKRPQKDGESEAEAKRESWEDDVQCLVCDKPIH